MPPPPPTSTLFPYTTLFRSQYQAVGEIPCVIPRGRQAIQVEPDARYGRENNTEQDEPERSHSRQDRKSTRLNSSHSQISYAVFCLKKKTKNTIKRHRHIA